MVRMVHLHARLGSKGQVVIPKPIRDQTSIGPGSRLTFELENGRIIIDPAPADALERFLAIVPPEERLDLTDVDLDAVYASQFDAHSFD